MFKLTFEMDNAAFINDVTPTARNIEIARILRDVAQRVDDDYEEGTIRDVNGNRIGQWTIHGSE